MIPAFMANVATVSLTLLTAIDQTGGLSQSRGTGSESGFWESLVPHFVFSTNLCCQWVFEVPLLSKNLASTASSWEPPGGEIVAR